MNSVKKRAIESFEKKDFFTAKTLYALAFNEDEEDFDVKAGLILCSLADEYTDEISSLFEFYSIANVLDQKNAYENLLNIVDAIEQGEAIDDIYNFNIEHQLANDEGISYEEFLLLVDESGDFKSVFNNVFFSTKVVITQKNDFFDFVNRLIENDYIDMALSYIENANNVFPSDDRLRELLDKINAMQVDETHH
jgi:tetratricopeptide (TPR) repeat protein